MNKTREEFTARDVQLKHAARKPEELLKHSPFSGLKEVLHKEVYRLAEFSEEIQHSFQATLADKFDTIPHGLAMRPSNLPGVNLVEFYETGDGLNVLLRYKVAGSDGVDRFEYMAFDIMRDGSVRSDIFPPELKGIDTSQIYLSVLKMLATLGMSKSGWTGAVTLPSGEGFDLPSLEGPQMPPGASSRGGGDASEGDEGRGSNSSYLHELRLSVIANHPGFIAAVRPALDTRGGGFNEYFGAVFRRGIILDAGVSGNAVYEFRFEAPLSDDEVSLLKSLYEQRWSGRKDKATRETLDAKIQDVLVAHGYGREQWHRTKREKVDAGERYGAHPSKNNPKAEERWYSDLLEYITAEYA